MVRVNNHPSGPFLVRFWPVQLDALVPQYFEWPLFDLRWLLRC